MNSPSCALHPDQFAGTTCPRCGNFTCVSCNPDGKTNCPTCQKLTADSQRGLVPWERREELGLVTAFWQQLKMTIFEPTKFWATVDRNRPAAEAFWFAWLVQIIAALGSLPYQTFNMWAQGGQLKQMQQVFGNSNAFIEYFSWTVQHPFVAAGALTLWTIVSFPIGFFVSTGLSHLGCVLAGMRNHPLAATMRAFGYANAANISLVIPVVGVFGSIYTLVLHVWGLRELQQGTTARSIFAVFWWVVIVWCCLVVAFATLFATVLSKLGKY